MTVDSRVLFMGEAMPRRRVSDAPAGAQNLVNLKGRQAAKIREIAEGLAAEGIDKVDAQAKALGLRRSPAWTPMQTETAIAPTASAKTNISLFHRNWPAAVIILGLALNAAWVALLGYGLVSIIKAVF